MGGETRWGTDTSGECKHMYLFAYLQFSKWKYEPKAKETSYLWGEENQVQEMEIGLFCMYPVLYI